MLCRAPSLDDRQRTRKVASFGIDRIRADMEPLTLSFHEAHYMKRERKNQLVAYYYFYPPNADSRLDCARNEVVGYVAWTFQVQRLGAQLTLTCRSGIRAAQRMEAVGRA